MLETSSGLHHQYDKSSGFNLENSKLRSTPALSRLCLVMAILQKKYQIEFKAHTHVWASKTFVRQSAPRH